MTPPIGVAGSGDEEPNAVQLAFDAEAELEASDKTPTVLEALETVLPRQPILAAVVGLNRPRITDYCAASAEYVRLASSLTAGDAKTSQVALSQALARVTLEDLRETLGMALPGAHAGERKVGGGLREVQADVSEMTDMHGLTLAVELKPVHLAVGRAIWNRFGDIRTFSVNIHLKFPFAVIGGVMTLPTKERLHSNDDAQWKSTAHLVERAIARFVRAGGRKTEGDAPHLLEAIAVVVFDHESGAIDPDIPPVGSGLRWQEFVGALAESYDARFGIT
ncbi:MAG: hypothetical protein ACYDD4_05880 [Acidimicrobiales bacterium]